MIQDEYSRAKALSAIAPQLERTERLVVLKLALKVAKAIQGDVYRTGALRKIAPHLSGAMPELLKQALEIAQATQSENNRAGALSAIAPQLKTMPDLMKLTLEEVQTIQNEHYRAETLLVIAPQLNESMPELLKLALKITQTIKSEYRRPYVLSAIAPQLNESDRFVVLRQALNSAQAIQYESNRTEALNAIVPQLNQSMPKLLIQALEMAQAMHGKSRAEALVTIASQLSESEREAVLDQAIEATQEITYVDQAQILSAIAAQVSEAKLEVLLKQALKAALEYREPSRAEVLSVIAPLLRESMPDLLKQSFDAIQPLQNESSRRSALCAITPKLSADTPELLQQALATAQAMQDESNRSDALSAIAPQFSDPERLLPKFSRDQLSAVLNLTEFQKDDPTKVQFLSILAPRLSIGLFPMAFQLVSQAKVQNEALRVEALSNLAPYLAEEQLSEAVTLCQPNPEVSDASEPPDININQQGLITQSSNRVTALTNLLPYLKTLEQYETACDIIRSISPPLYQAQALTPLATELATERIASIVKNTPETLNLSKYSPPLPPKKRFTKLVDRIWGMIQELEGDEHMTSRANILCCLIPAMSIAQVDAVEENLRTPRKGSPSLFDYQNLDTTHRFTKDTGYIAQVLDAIVTRRLSDHFIYHNDSDRDAIFTLRGKADFIADDVVGQVKILRHIPDNSAITTAQNIPCPFQKAEALVEIACHPSQKQHQYQALQHINRLSNNSYLQSQYLQRLIPHLQASQRLEDARVIQDINQPYYRTQALIALACKFPQFRPDAKASALALDDDIQKIEQLSLLAVEKPELIPEIIDLLEAIQVPSTTKSPDNTAEWFQAIKRRSLLIALAPHLPMRINREVNRKHTGCDDDLWDRALYLLARGYRDALSQGSLRNESAQDEDLLNLKDEVNALAELLLMRDLEPPMAVGILGGWGGGKSYIMHLMQSHMTKIRSRPIKITDDDKSEAWNPDPNHENLSPYVGHIYQIKFDAWTFAKSDLWASLMQTIFFELDRQLTLEKQIKEVLDNISASETAKRQALESKIWPVLYKTSNDDRQWFLKRVLNDQAILDQLSTKQIGQEAAGVLWATLNQTQEKAIQQFRKTQSQLKLARRKFDLRKASLRKSIRDEFAPLTQFDNLKTGSKQFRRVDAIFGTSFILLKKRIGPQLFAAINQEIYSQLYEKAEPVNDADSHPTQRSKQENTGLWRQLNQTLEKLEKSQKELAEIEASIFESTEKQDQSADHDKAPDTKSPDTKSPEANTSSSKNDGSKLKDKINTYALQLRTCHQSDELEKEGKSLIIVAKIIASEAEIETEQEDIYYARVFDTFGAISLDEEIGDFSSDETFIKNLNAAFEAHEEEKAKKTEVNKTHNGEEDEEPNIKISEELEQELRRRITASINHAEINAEVNKLTQDVKALQLDIYTVAATVIDKKNLPITLNSLWQWFKRNWVIVGLGMGFFIFPWILWTFLDINLITIFGTAIDKAIAWIAAVLASILPTFVTLQSLLSSSRKWFDETQQALQTYEKSVEDRNKQLEVTIEATVEARLQTDSKLQQQERKVQQLETQLEQQRQALPVNEYASLNDFVNDRLSTKTYASRLGLMQQVKDDLFDLSNKLLPPSGQRLESKIGFLKEAFPRGPARVVVYIDDLDRCPPDRVVEVLEAVQLLVKTPLFIAVLAIDERYITRALEKHYGGILSRQGRPSGTDYLEKIIQLPYRVRPIMPDALDSYLRSQIVIQDGGSGGAKFSEFTRQEFDMLLECCKQIDLSPRSLKRLTNVYKLFKIVCRTRGTKIRTNVQQAILALLALSGRYPDLMRSIFDDIETCFEEYRTEEKAKTIDEAKAKRQNISIKFLNRRTLHRDSSLREFFEDYQLLERDEYRQRELDQLMHDTLHTTILPDITLQDMTHQIFNLIRSFSFVGEIGEDPEDYRVSAPLAIEQSASYEEESFPLDIQQNEDHETSPQKD
ncbi:MAG: P-loop NTPase fold protein [Cyanobacteria bacterium J06627_8]